MSNNKPHEQPKSPDEYWNHGLISDYIAANAPMGIIILDKELRYRVWNPYMEKLRGVRAEQVIGHRPAELFPELVKAGVVAGLERALEGESIPRVEYAIPSPDGVRPRWQSVSIDPLRSMDGKIVGVICMVLDITERKRAEERLRTSDELFKAIATSSPDLVLAQDRDLRYTFLLNPAAGFDPDAAIGKTDFDLVAPEQAALLTQIKTGVMLSGQSAHFRSTNVSPEGKTEIFDGSYIPKLGANGAMDGIIGYFRNITEQVSSREEVARLLEESQSIINTVREPLITLDQDLRVVSASRSFYEVFRVKPEETLGQLIYDLGNKQWDIPKLRELLETILPNEASFDNYVVEHDFATIGRRIMVLNARRIQGGAGKKGTILLAIEDLTDLKKAYADLGEQAIELKRAQRAKDEFLANMSHEMRTPLNSINGFSEVLYDEAYGTLNEKQKRYAYLILTSGKHLLLLINQILDMAKIASGKMTLDLARISLTNTLNEIFLLMADMAGKKKLYFTLTIAKDLPEIEADELKVREILYNLLSNAISFTPEGGTIELRAARTQTAVEIVIRDTRVAIAAENLLRVFEGFYRVDSPYSRVTAGTGLGLPLSKKLVELHGGELFVESEGLDKGTTVRFTLPLG